ncbi:MFS transporter [Actinoplanes utahensis]|uniref:Major facilitator superfamily (MFS) profile domain-containing protein n=1 Tax=Actinoplanes utahensis TaxID=1869 RepID=A0A0A6UN52_ACTUT|nr:MFS transporter [Actinoplanes utahensis]KHD76821.1 hypothetical protein MB27_14860 [Actinoplanes utahensis]GIF33398.1 MFS transporter [Actinoplanes utahensis]
MTNTADRVSVPLRSNRDFGLLWVSAAFSFLGTRATALVYPMLVLWNGGSTTLAGLAGFAALLPQLVIQLPAGAYVDRWDRRRLMLVCEWGSLLALGSLAAAVLTDRLWLPHLFAVAFIEGSLMVFYQLAERAAVPQLVAPDQLGAAYSQNEARTRGAALLGQPIGTSLFALGNALPLVFGAAVRLVSIGTLWGIRTRFQEKRRDAPAPDVRAEISAGLSWVWRQRFLRAVMLVMALTNMLFQMLTFAMLPLFHDEGRSEALVGVVLACSSLGGLIGALTAAAWMRRWSLRRILLAGTGVWAVVTTAIAFAPDVVSMGVLFAASGYVGGVFNVPAIVYVMRITPPDMQGRVGSVASMVAFGGMAFGWAAAGPLLTVVAPRTGIAVIGATLALVALAAAISPAIRRAHGTAETKPLG